MNNKLLILILGIIVLTAFVVGAFIVLNRQSLQDVVQNSPSPVISQNVVNTTPTPTMSDSNAPPNWETYTSEDPNFAIKHPEEVEVNTSQPSSVSFNRIGPTQAQGTELFDGFNITISQNFYSPTNFESFRGFVEIERQTKENDPATQSVDELQPVTISGRQGFKFTQNALGEFTLIYLPTKSNEYFLISNMVADPGNLGFEDTVNTMLNSLSF